jgi:hypothetical protein
MKRIVIWLSVGCATFAVGLAATLKFFNSRELSNPKIEEVTKNSNQNIASVSSASIPPEKNKVQSSKTITVDEKLRFSIKDSKGLLVLADGYDKPNDFIEFFNEDGSRWYQFTFYYDDSDGNFEYENGEFLPFSFHPDYFRLALKVVGEDSKRWKVVVNEETGLTKYAAKNVKNLKFESWEKNILNSSIEFTQKENPMREAPNAKLKKFRVSEFYQYNAVEIKGDWLRVKWDEGSKTNSGWIRWKEAGTLLIEWNSLC